MLKTYEYNGLTYQYEEGRQPEGAVEVKAAPKAEKGAAKADKALSARNKGR